MPFKHKLARRLAMAVGFAGAVALTTCEHPIGAPPADGVARLEISPQSVIVQPNQAVTLMAVAFTAANDTAAVDVSWSASAGSVTNQTTAGGRHYGQYQSTACGAYTVTATAQPGGKSASASVLVCTPVAWVDVSPASATAQVGSTVQLTAVPEDSTDTPLQGRTVTWASSAPSVATVSAAGLVTAVKVGSATITATSEGKSGTAAITVVNVPVTSVDVSPATLNLQVNGSAQLTATPRDASGAPLTGRAIAWASSAPGIASVSATGLVTGVAVGTATITATSEGKSGTATVTVANTPVASVTVTPSSAAIVVGQTIGLTATPRDASGAPLAGRAIVWSSDNAAVATVSGSGLVTGQGAGTATITATSEGQSGTAAVTVSAPSGSAVVLAGAGDITGCGQDNDEATAKLLDSLRADVVYTLGDNVYPYGYLSNYQSCYDPTWGRHKARTKPSPGNHDYDTQPGAPGYYQYFGALAGDSGVGYYSYDVGSWHIISLSSNTGGPSMSAGSAQETWLKADLAASTKRCTIAYWHHPRWSSGTHGSDSRSAAIIQDLYTAGAEIVLVGHDHLYERFAPQDPSGQLDVARGIREFVVGTGGESHYAFNTPLPNSEVRDNTSFGVLKLTLYADSYTWEFVPIAGASFRDSGSGTCH